MFLSSWINWPSRIVTRQIVIGFLLGLSFSWYFTSLGSRLQQRRKERHLRRSTPTGPIKLTRDAIVRGVTGLIGNTPLVRINSLSDALGVEILGKAEFLNPGGSVKDRVALQIIDDAERVGFLQPHTGSRIFEGTVGSTGISLSTIARARGYETTIIMPDDVADEKVKALLALGADVERVRPASIVDKKQAICRESLASETLKEGCARSLLQNLARQRAKEFGQKDGAGADIYTMQSPSESILVSAATQGHSKLPSKEGRGYFADQFESRSNYYAHYNGTGPEIWSQTNGQIDAFIAGAGTGGTVAGTGHYLKSMNKDIYIAIADPAGSGLFNKVKHGVMYDGKESEGTKRRHQVDTIVEGIGINRMTHNIALALPIVDDAFRITDAEAVAMSRYLVKNDGFFLGSSSACNLMACVKLVKQMGWTRQGKTIVTVLCDSGTRHYSKFWNDDFMENANVPVDLRLVENLLRSSPQL